MESRKMILMFAVIVMLNLVLVSAAETVYETASVSRIVGDTADDMLKSMSRDSFRFEHATLVSDEPSAPGYRNEKANLLEGFTDKEIDDPYVFYKNEESYNWENNEFVVVEDTGSHTESLEEKVDILDESFWKESFRENEPFMIYSVPGNNIHWPGGDSVVNSYSEDGMILAGSYSSDPEFTQALLCNLGHYSGSSIGELYTEARNKYYQKAPSKAIGLNLMSYNLFGFGAARYNVPEIEPGRYEQINYLDPRHPTADQTCNGGGTTTEKCYDYNLFIPTTKENNCRMYIDWETENKGHPLYPGNYASQAIVETDKGFFAQNLDDVQTLRVEVDFSEYSIIEENNLSFLVVNGSDLWREENELVLPVKVIESAFPFKTVVTGAELVDLEDPVSMTIENMSTWIDGYEEKFCLFNEKDAGIEYRPSFTEEEELILVTVDPVEVVDCEEGEIKLYQKVIYEILYIPYSPVFIDVLEYPEEVVPGELVDVDVLLENTKSSAVSGVLRIMEGDEVIVGKTVDTVILNHSFTFAAPSKSGTYDYVLEFVHEDEVKTFKTFSIEVRSIDAKMIIGEGVAVAAGSGTVSRAVMSGSGTEGWFEGEFNDPENAFDGNWETAVTPENFYSEDMATDGCGDTYYVYENFEVPSDAGDIEWTIKASRGTFECTIPNPDLTGDTLQLRIPLSARNTYSYCTPLCTMEYREVPFACPTQYWDGEEWVQAEGEIIAPSSCGPWMMSYSNGQLSWSEEVVTSYKTEYPISLSLFNYLSTGLEASISSYLVKDGIIRESISSEETFASGSTLLPLTFNNLERSGRSYTLISDIVYGNEVKTVVGEIVTNKIPVVESIGDITVEIGEDVVVEVVASDPDGDSLTYSIDAERFVKEGNVFTWTTGEDDFGDHEFEVSVSDGLLIGKKTVSVMVEDSGMTPDGTEDATLLYRFSDGAVLKELEVIKGVNQTVYLTIPKKAEIIHAQYEVEGR
ncbi:Ig-like domain-containing protein [Nanoarchaeota archaeon]